MHTFLYKLQDLLIYRCVSYLAVKHLMLELSEGVGHGDLPLGDAGEKDGDGRAVATRLIEGDDEMIVLHLGWKLLSCSQVKSLIKELT